MKTDHCGCCGSLLEFPDHIKCFRCTICLAINDIDSPSSPGLSNRSPEQPSPSEPLTLTFLQSLVYNARESNNYEHLEKVIAHLFSDFETLTNSFSSERAVSEKDCGIDLDNVRQAYAIILQQPPAILRTMMSSLSSLLQRLGRRIEQKEDLKAFLIILENPLLLRRSNEQELQFHHHLLRRIYGYLSRLSGDLVRLLVRWFSQLDVDVFRGRIECIHHFIAIRLREIDQHRGRLLNPDWSLVAAAKVMSMYFSANDRIQKVQTSDFYNTLVDSIDLLYDYDCWQKNRTPFSFCQYPFLISMGSKIKIMEIDAKRQMEKELQDAFFTSFFQRSGEVMPFLVLHIRRSHIISDSLNQLSRKGHELKKKLRIEFDDEEGVDAGGLTKEWFLILIRELFNPQYGMFTIDEESMYIWFNACSLENDNEFFLVGVIIGLALYNSTILDVNFPMACYKKLLNHAVTLDDLEKLRPSLGSGLRKLLEYDGEVEDVFCLTYEASQDAFGEIQRIPLVENGSNVSVTNENREDYVLKYVDHVLNNSVKNQFESFKRGFYYVCGGNALSLFRPEEIELLVHGQKEIDLSTLKAVTIYEGFRPEEEFIKDFWELIESFDQEMKRKFLSFVTGTNYLPPVEATSLTFKITNLGSDTTKFPMSHTCFNQICIPKYPNKEELRDKLTRAILESEGFGLK